jgi:hypothetical protein
MISWLIIGVIETARLYAENDEVLMKTSLDLSEMLKSEEFRTFKFQHAILFVFIKSHSEVTQKLKMFSTLTIPEENGAILFRLFSKRIYFITQYGL